MKVENKIQIGLCFSSGKLGKAITTFEQLDCPGMDLYWSHAFLKSPNPQPNPYEYLMIDAKADGVGKEKWEDIVYYKTMIGKAKAKFILCEFTQRLTDEQIKRIADKAYSLIDNAYDKPSLLFSFPVKIFLKTIKLFKNLWLGPTGGASERMNTCGEVAALASNAGTPDFFPNPWEVSPQNIYQYVKEGKLKIVYKSF
jgi:hypothetical protein